MKKKFLAILLTLAMCLSLGVLGACSHTHEWSDWEVTTAATCTEKGVETRTCECGEEETREIAALGHNWGAAEIENGNYVKECSRCHTKQTLGAVGSSEEYPLVVSTADALTAAMQDGGYIQLSADATVTAADLNAALAANRTAPATANAQEFVPAPIYIDLNGNEMTVSSEAEEMTVVVESGQTLCISNGTLTANNTTGSGTSFLNKANSTMIFQDLVVTATGTFAGPEGEDSRVDVINCDITVSGAYVVATNAATQDNYGVEINIENSTLTATQSMPICMNVGGTLNVSDSDINGDGQGVLVRAGTANFDNVNITVTVAAGYWDMFETGEQYISNPSGWGSGNRVAYGALIVGDTAANSYNASAIVNFNGGSINCVAAQGETVPAERLFAVYAVQLNGTYNQAPDASYTTEITFGGDVEISGQVINFNDTAEVSGLSADVTVLGQWNSEEGKFEATAPAVEEQA